MRAAACPYTRAIDRSSQAGYRSILVPMSLAYTHVPPAPIRTPEWPSRPSSQRRILIVTQPRVTPEHEHQLVTIFRNTFTHLVTTSLALVPFCFGGSRHGWRLFVEQTNPLQTDLRHSCDYWIWNQGYFIPATRPGLKATLTYKVLYGESRRLRRELSNVEISLMLSSLHYLHFQYAHFLKASSVSTY